MKGDRIIAEVVDVDPDGKTLTIMREDGTTWKYRYRKEVSKEDENRLMERKENGWTLLAFAHFISVGKPLHLEALSW